MLRQWLELYTTHLLGLNRPASTVDGYRPKVSKQDKLFIFSHSKETISVITPG